MRIRARTHARGTALAGLAAVALLLALAPGAYAHSRASFRVEEATIADLQAAIRRRQVTTSGMRTTSGGDAFWADDRPPDDATVVARLRAAGALILAKANLDEYAGGPARSSFG